MPRKKSLTLPIPEPDMNAVVTKGQGVKGPIIKLNGKEVTKEQLSQLKGEVSHFKSMLLYRILMETLKWEAKEIIFNKSQDFQDVLNGKSMLRTVDTQENIIKLLE